MGTRVSFSKQEIKQDKFADFMNEGRDWAADNMSTILGIVAVVVLLGVGLYFFSDYRAGQAEAARAELAQAKTKMLSGNLQVGLLELRAVADKYSGSETGAEALYMLGSANYLNKNYDQAMQAFEEYVKKYNSMKVTHDAALAGIAACKENTGAYAEAAQQYLKALDYYPEAPIAEDNALGALRNYLYAGDTANARKMLDRIDSDFWQSPVVITAKRLFEEIKPVG